MKIAASLPLYPPGSRVGAWLTTHEFLAALAAAGHQVQVRLSLPSAPFAYELDGVQVHPRASLDEITEGADVLVSHLGDDQKASIYARQHAIPSVRMVHGIPGSGHMLDDDLAVFNSASLAHAVGWSGPSIVARPPVRATDYRTTPGDLVTLVNFSTAKGGHVLWSLARRMPDVQFLAVRGSYGQQVTRSSGNVEVIDATPDMAGDVYARTRILLMPSKAETWGRTGIEAACSGIPTIAHPTDGLVESLGNAGTFVDRNDLHAWERAVRRLKDPVEWAAASALALARSAELDPTPDLARFVAAVEDLASVGVAA